MTYTCAICRQPYTAPPSAQRRVCSRACGYRLASRRLKGKAPSAANDARLIQMRERSRNRLRAEFGELSVREIQIIRVVYWAAHYRGYQRALKRQPRQQAA